MTAYRSDRKVRFEDCDPAGIVFYPRYFEMLNATVEEWFEEGLDLPWRVLVLERKNGVPTVHIEAEFLAVSRLGDVLTFTLEVEKIGRSSAVLRVVAACGDEERALFRLTLVHFSNETFRSKLWPEDLRVRMGDYQTESVVSLGE